MSPKKLFLLSVLGGALLFLAWPPHGFPVILFFAFIPLLWIEHQFSSEHRVRSKPVLLFGLSYLTFFIWNISTTWWIWHASPGGAMMAILANSLIMTIIFFSFHIVKKRLATSPLKFQTSNWLFVIFWLAFEHFHYRWELTWPWLTLGNAFAKNHTWIQWYEYTGTAGGSLWALILNVLCFEWLTGKTGRWKPIALLIVLPIIISFLIYYSFNNTTDSRNVNVVVVQPNIDPYSEKFHGMNFEEQLYKMLGLAKQKVDSLTDYLVFPETALTETIWENELEHTGSIKILKDFLKKYPELKIVTGASTYYLFQKEEALSVTARKHGTSDAYFDVYNTALQIDNTNTIQVYHKSKLVPGVERMPYPALFGFLESFAIDLGGTAGSLGTQEERTAFDGGTTKVAPVICYESVFGEYVCDYINNGASLIFIITNDGWWGNSPGYKQHLLYGRLRSIETRKCIARSANTGISCFIDERGNFSQLTKWWTPAVIKNTITVNQERTFYTKYGDIIGRISLCLLALTIVFVVIDGLRQNIKFGCLNSR